MTEKSSEKLASQEESNLLAGNWKITTTSALQGAGGLIPLPLQNLIAGDEVPFEVLIRTRIAGEDKDQFKSCCQPGQVFESSWLEKLQNVGVNRVYFRQQDEPQVLNYLTRRLPLILADNLVPVKEKADRLLDVTHLWVQQFFSETETIAVQQLKQGFKYVDILLKFIPQDHYHRSWLLDLCRRDQTLYSHCLNTSLLGMAFAKYLGWGDKKISGSGARRHAPRYRHDQGPRRDLEKNGGVVRGRIGCGEETPQGGLPHAEDSGPDEQGGLAAGAAAS